MSRKYYTIESHHGSYVVWVNTESIRSEIGSKGCYGIFRGTYKECKNFCKENNIKVTKRLK